MENKNTENKVEKPIPEPELEHYDLIVVGANIIGAGTARDAAQRGLKVALVNMEDFAGGCNANPGELVFGVDRFIDKANLRLSYSAARERRILRNSAPQLVKDIPFIIPRPTANNLKKNSKNLGLQLYDFLAGFDKSEQASQLSAQDLQTKLPGINQSIFQSGAMFYDCNVNDYRLTVTNILDAVDNKAKVFNYCFVEKVEPFMDKLKVFVKDLLTNKTKEMVCSSLVNSTGPYTNYNLGIWGLSPYEGQKILKSIHFFVPTISERYAFLVNPQAEKRLLYAVPWENATMVGLTDTEELQSMECPSVKQEELNYALGQLNLLFPEIKLTHNDVLAPMAGIKAYMDGYKHKIIKQPLGKAQVISVFGGKLTLYRRIAEEVVDKVVSTINKKVAASQSATSRFRGSQFNEGTFKSFIEHRLISTFELQKLPIDVSMNLLKTYGTEVNNFEFIPFLGKPHATERIVPGGKDIWAQLYYCKQKEFVRLPSDFAIRRTNLFLDLLKKPEFIPAFYQQAGEILGLSPEETKKDLLRFYSEFKVEGNLN